MAGSNVESLQPEVDMLQEFRRLYSARLQETAKVPPGNTPVGRPQRGRLPVYPEAL